MSRSRQSHYLNDYDMYEELGSEELLRQFKNYKGMNKLSLLFKSRTFYTVVIVGLYYGLTGVTHLFPSIAVLNDLVGVLGFVMINYFHVNPSQNYSA